MWVAVVIIAAIVLFIVGGTAYMVWERREWRFDASTSEPPAGEPADGDP